MLQARRLASPRTLAAAFFLAAITLALGQNPAFADDPFPCFSDPECDDGDPCTDDWCDTGLGCQHDPDLTDGNGDEIPDCVPCPPLDVVFVMDTSGTMADEARALCTSIGSIVATLASAGVDVQATFLGITQTRGGDFACLTDTVSNLLGTAVPGNPACGRTLNHNEDWASATAIVAASFPWNTDAVRVIVPMGDEGPQGGNPCDDPGDDRDAITNAIAIAVANGVFVAPITGTGSNSCVTTLAADLAAGTGGTVFISTDPATDLAEAVQDIVVHVCLEAGSGPLGDGDNCPYNPDKSEPGLCGCGVPDTDTDGDNISNCLDNCPGVANPDQADADDDEIGDACEDEQETTDGATWGCGASAATAALLSFWSLCGAKLARRRRVRRRTAHQ